MFKRNPGIQRRSFGRGEVIVVRDLDEILATLDAEGKLEGLPFMPEMVAYCGRAMRVARHVENVFLDRHYFVGRLAGTVLLENARCDGTSHSGCQMGCNLLWKEAWLRPAKPREQAGPEPAATSDSPGLPPAAPHLPTEKDGRFVCQATELIRAIAPLPWWDVRHHGRALVRGETSLARLLHMLALVAIDKLFWRIGRLPYGTLSGDQNGATGEALDLQPGELVEVKSREEIRATLDAEGKHRGLAFVPDMIRHCGRRYRVARRVGRMIVEWNGQARDLRDTVALEGVACRGIVQRCCPRACFHLWREIWLKRVS